jgi:hypothetical protein
MPKHIFWLELVLMTLLGVALFDAMYSKPEGFRDMRPIQGSLECEIAKGKYLEGPITFEAGVHRTVAEKVKDVCKGGTP